MPGDKYHDLTLRCGSEVMGLHRVVVCGGSRVLDKMLDSSVQDGNKSVIELPEEDVKVVRKAMRFLYTGDYEAKEISTKPDDNVEGSSVTVGETPLTSRTLLLHVDVYAFGYHYAIPKLQEMASTKFNDAVREGDAWATEVLPTLITKVYNTTPPTEKGLRDIIAGVCALHIDILLSIPEFADVMVDVPGVALDILRKVQNFRAFDGSETRNEEIEALERQLENCSLEKSETEKRLKDEAEIAREQFTSLKETIKMLEVKNKSIEEKAVKDLGKARDYSKGLNTRIQSLEQQATSFRATTAEKKREHDEELAKLQKQIKDLKSNLQQAQSNTKSAQDACAQARAESTSERAKLDAAIDRMIELEDCRHCGEGFNGYIERTADGGTLVRCDYCNTRHW